MDIHVDLKHEPGAMRNPWYLAIRTVYITEQGGRIKEEYFVWLQTWEQAKKISEKLIRALEKTEEEEAK